MILRLPLIHKFVFAISLAVFSVSILSQYAGDAKPCQLCLISRYSFLSIAILSYFSGFSDKLRSILFSAIFLLFAFSFYHLGVENHWWAGPQSCVSELPTLSNLSEFNTTSNKVFCDKANWIIFGLSSTLWSFLIAAFLAWLISISYILNYYLDRKDD